MADEGTCAKCGEDDLRKCWRCDAFVCPLCEDSATGLIYGEHECATPISLAVVERALAMMREDRGIDISHRIEDRLYRAVLEGVRDGTLDGDPQAIAAAALTSQTLKFARYYA